MNLEPEFVLLIKTRTAKFFPQAKIFLFGSRARKTNRKFSDIDLAIKDLEINPQTLALLKFELEESALPYKVDLVNYDELDAEILLGAIEI